MRHFVRQTAILFLVVLAGHAQAQSGPRRWSDRENLGLHGPVHTQRVVSQKLSTDPRKNPSIDLAFSGIPWLVFDVAGGIVEQADSYSEDGAFSGMSRMVRDESGQVIETISLVGDTITRSQSKLQMGPYGPVEVTSTSNGKLDTRVENEYDEDGNIVEQRTYDAHGRRLASSSTRYDSEGHILEWKVIGPDDHFSIHILNRYDDDEMTAREWYDAQGRMFRSVALRDGKITSWWQAVECRCEDNIGFVFHNRETVTYFSRPDGILHTEIATHPGRYGNIEPDEVKLYDESRNLIEMVSYRYERDSIGNWISRLVLVWIPETGELRPVRKDFRALTYH